MKFCDACNNLLDISTENDKLEFKCLTCFKLHGANDRDTLLYEFYSEKEDNNLATILNKSEIYLSIAHMDELANNVNEKCKYCDETIIKQIYIGQCIYICPTCKKQFIKN